MDVAIVTGADSRFGDSVIRTLLKMGFRVHALGQSPDATTYDGRYVVCHSYGPGKLAELKACLDSVLSQEGRLDLLVSLGGPELTSGWESSAPEALVRRLHGCLTEPILAANICIPALRTSKGFLIHGHRRRVCDDLEVSDGYFEDGIRRAYDDLFIRYASTGLRSARLIYAFPDGENESSVGYNDVADAVSRAFETILRQKETCVIREIQVGPRGLVPAGRFPDLVPGLDPYQNTVLPEKEDEDTEPILIPTEKPRHYVQIAELKDVTGGEDDPDADEAWEPETVEKKPDAGARKKRPPRKRSRRRKKPTEGADSSGDQSSDGPKEASGTSSNPDPAITAPPENHAPEHNQDDSDQPKPRPRKRPGRRRNKKSPSAETSPESTESTREEPGEAPEP